MYRVLVSDVTAKSGLEILEREVEVDFLTDLSREKFLSIIKNYDALIVRSMTEVDVEVLDRAKKLKVIGRAGTGYDNINVQAATKRGIVVFNTPHGNTISAVEHTMGLILALSRNIPQANRALHRGFWNRKKYMGTEINNKTLGIIGLGKIGSRVAIRARGFGMKIIANDPYLAPERAKKLNIPLLNFKEVLRKSDYISLHTPLTDETYHILDHKEFAIMKDGVRIINCARGKNINTRALSEAIEKGKVGGAAIDVHEKEPFTPGENPLIKYEDRVIMTCHLGGTTSEAMNNVSIKAAREVLAVLKGNLPESPLNMPAIDNQKLNKLQPYLDLTTKLGNFLAYWKGHERIKQIEIEYGGKITEHNLKPFTINTIKSVLSPVLDDRINFVNALHIAGEREITVKKSQIEEPEELKNIIRTRVTTGKGKYSLSGTALPIGLRIIEINNCRIDLKLSGKFLIAAYRDQPGVIGKIGTILGENEINIASMQVGRKKEGGMAIMIIQTDTRPGEKTLQKIKKESDTIKLADLSYIDLN